MLAPIRWIVTKIHISWITQKSVRKNSIHNLNEDVRTFMTTLVTRITMGAVGRYL